MQKGTVHIVATVLWGIFGIVVGTTALITHQYNDWVGYSLITAIAGNSAHLIMFSLSKTGAEIQAAK